jgi:hypothetical protein
MPALTATPTRAMVDMPRHVVATGFPPGQPVEITASLVQNDGSLWRSWAIFLAAPDGSVDLSRDAPLAGDWSGVDRELFESLRELRRDLAEERGVPAFVVLLAERARAAGVTVECRLWPQMPHVWQFLAGLLPEARESLDAAGAFVRTHVPAGRIRRPD